MNEKIPELEQIKTSLTLAPSKEESNKTSQEESVVIRTIHSAPPRRHSSKYPRIKNIHITQKSHFLKQSWVPLTSEADQIMELIQELSLKIDLDIQKEHNELMKKYEDLKKTKEEIKLSYSKEEQIYQNKIQAIKQQENQEKFQSATLVQYEDQQQPSESKVIFPTLQRVNLITQEQINVKLVQQKEMYQSQLNGIIEQREKSNNELKMHFTSMMTNKVKLQSELHSLENIRNELLARKFAIKINKRMNNDNDNSNIITNSEDSLGIQSEDNDQLIKINKFADKGLSAITLNRKSFVTVKSNKIE